MESCYFQRPTGLLFQGPCTAQCNFPWPNIGMYLWNRQNRLGSAQTLAAHEDALLLSSTMPAQNSDTQAKEPLPKPVKHLVLIKSLWTPFAGYRELWRQKYIAPKLVFFFTPKKPNILSLLQSVWECVHTLVSAGWVIAEHCYLRMELFTERKVLWAISSGLQSKIYMIFSGLTM